MSDAPHPQTPHKPKSYKAGHSGATGMKWLAGAGAAALLLGGGYYAWTKASSNQSPTEIADAYFSSPSATEEAAGDASIVQELPTAAPVENYNEPPPVTQSAPAPAKPKKTQVAAAIPTATIGVSEAGVAANQSDDVIVNAPRRPVWTRMPSAARLSSYYPANALDRGREGEASLRCTVGERGALDCVRVSETPARAGFGAAALRVSRTLRHAEKNADGQNAIGTPVNLRILFRMAEDERRG